MGMNGTRSVCMHPPQVGRPCICPRLVSGARFPFIQSHGCVRVPSRSKEWNPTELLENLVRRAANFYLCVVICWLDPSRVHALSTGPKCDGQRQQWLRNSNCPSQGTGTAHCRGEVA